MEREALRASQRNVGIDGLRIIAMFMVVILHTLGNGGVLDAATPLSIQYEAAWFLEIAAYCAVNCYAIISGYVGVTAKYRYSNIVVLWLRVVFYTVLITLVFRIWMPEMVGWSEYIAAISPVFHSQYWYFTAYFGLFFLLPLVNLAVGKMTRKQYAALMVLLSMLYSVVPTLLRQDMFRLNNGYSVWWLLILYLIGGYIRKYGLLEDLKKGIWPVLYVAAVGFTWLSKLVLERTGHGGDIFVSYLSPTILLAAIALVQFFKKCSFSKTIARSIGVLSPAAFSVYIIHKHPFVDWHILYNRFAQLAALPAYKLVGIVLLTALGIYLACSAIDLVREKIFKALRIKQRISALEMKLIGNVWAE